MMMEDVEKYQNTQMPLPAVQKIESKLTSSGLITYFEKLSDD